ncbi:hypothetical protein E9549_13705 [Blastococcus sp. MG754426]|uniref:hypothetical protein n=1 Tax=unclassified Blastococcus TaxID=2619396 RepID=UPI001EF040CD|nr:MULTISPECIES: hypothetical protein [unclassified Blastococcus]MCF6508454.1 hypothetical protein [Blastococcus sp. MG754426]MCF6513455.1 hypothetical protein [Blastococcus sp. MG754427]
MLTKAAVFLGAVPLMLLVVVTVGSPDLAATMTAAASAAAAGLSPAWFFTGTAQPARIIYTESIPRMVAAVAASIVLLLGAPLWSYGALMLVGTTAAPIAGWWIAGRSNVDVRLGLGLVWVSMKRQALALSGRVASTFYLSLPTVVLAAVVPSVVPAFAAADRLQRMGLTVLASVPASLQNWVGTSANERVRAGRLRKAVLANAAMGLVAGGAFAILAPTVSSLLFSNQVAIEYSTSSLCAGVIALTCVSRVTGGLGLVSVGRIGWLSASAFVGAVVGPALVAFFGVSYGVDGAILGLILAETSVLAVQVAALRNGLRAATS